MVGEWRGLTEEYPLVAEIFRTKDLEKYLAKWRGKPMVSP